jgi:hypothetical protein
MSDKQTFEISVDISWDGGETTEKVIIDDATYDYDDIVSAAFDAAEDVGVFENFEDITQEDCDFEIHIDDGDLEDLGITNDDELYEFCDIFYSDNNSYEIEVFQAAYECDIPFEDIDEMYQGQWDDDEDFVMRLLEDTGMIPSDLPNFIHIDWGRTAETVMDDYVENRGHYFRQ